MNPSISPTPPPIQSQGGSQNPYDFITNPGTPPKKSLMGGDSKIQRIMIFIGALAVLLIIVILVFSLLSGGEGELKNDYQSVVNQQSELIRISSTGVEKARNKEAKNLAITAKLSLESSQAQLYGLASKSGAKTDAKYLLLIKNSVTDEKLSSAEQSNSFDEVFIELLIMKLDEYKQSIQKLYDQTTQNDSKLILQQAHDNAVILMQNGS